MGHVILEYRGNDAVFSDVLLWMLRCFLLSEARRREFDDGDSELSALREFLEGWEWPGPGVVMGTDFEKYIGESANRRQVLLDHIQHTGERIAKFGEFIPMSYLIANVDCGAPAWDRDFETWRLLRVVGRICNLLTHVEGNDQRIYDN